MTTITQTISAITPSDPRTMTRDQFSTEAPKTVVDIADMVTELNTWGGQVNTVAGEVNTNATSAAASAVSAAASASAASAVAGATAWMTGTTYALNAAAISQIDFLTYRKKTASSVSTIDPKNDATNWVCINTSSPTWTTITADPGPAVSGGSYQCNTTSAAFTVTLPAAPAANDVVRIADYAGTFSTNNLTVGRNALKIMGLAEDMVISTNNRSVTLTYIDATQGWRVVA